MADNGRYVYKTDHYSIIFRKFDKWNKLEQDQQVILFSQMSLKIIEMLSHVSQRIINEQKHQKQPQNIHLQSQNIKLKLISSQMQKMHRRKNEEIAKVYICTEGCGKAYGSSAALYTHMKNKHGCSKSIANPRGEYERKTGKKGRPICKQKQSSMFPLVANENVCKLCLEDDCICDSSINQQDVQDNIRIMSDRGFLKLLNCIGNLNIDQNFTWFRSSEQQYKLLTKQQLNKIIEKIKPANKIDYQWAEYLLHLSKFLDPLYMNELYTFILIVITSRCQNQLELQLDYQSQFKNIKKCKQVKKKEWAEFLEALRNI